MLKSIAGVFNGFDASNKVNHVFQTFNLRFIKNGTCVHTFMHVGFCNSSWNSIKDTLNMKPWKTCHELSAKVYKIRPFHACAFLN